MVHDGTATAVLAAGTAEIGKLAAGSASIGTLGANSGVDIGDVDIIGPALTALQLIDNSVVVLGTDTFTEATSSGNVMGAVRNDTLATLTDTDNEFAPLQVNAAGALYVEVATAASTAVTNTGTFAVQAVLGAGTAEFGKLAAGTAAIGKLAANSGVDIGDVDVTTVVPGTAAGNLGKAEDGAHTTADGGAMSRVWTSTVLTAGTAEIGKLAAGTAEIGKLAAGTAAIGKLAANSGVDIGDVDVASQPARVATTDTIGAALMTDVIHDGTTALTPKYAIIDAASSGDNTLVAAVTAKKLRVLALYMVSAGTVSARFESGAAGTALSGQMNLVANSGFTLPFNPVGWFETGSNVLLNLELSGAVSCDGSLVYVEV